MKIGIDCRMLGPEQGGLGRYLEQLVYHLSLIDHKNEYVLFLRKVNFESVHIGSSKFKYTKIVADIPWYGIKEQLVLPGIIKKSQIDLMHWPHWNFPLWYRGPLVVTIHDLIMYHYPRAEATTLGPLYYWIKEKISRVVIKKIIHQAAHILTTSEFTSQDIQTEFAISAKNITVTYQAATLPVYTKDVNITTLPGVSKPYVLYVGAAYPHKNLERLIEAWPHVQKATNHAYQLVLIGRTNYFYKKLQDKVVARGLTDIVFTGFVQDSELPKWYAGARLFVFPSLYEGFGLPPLEAWTQAVPVLAAKASCLPEILRTGALYFDPNSVTSLVDSMILGLDNNTLRAHVLYCASLEQKKYSWESCAQKTLAVYQNVL